MEALNTVEMLPVKAPEAGSTDLPFLPTATVVQQEKMEHLGLIVAKLAMERAKQCGSEVVSPRHVEMAWEQSAIATGTSQAKQATFGGISLGAGVGNILAIISSSSPPTTLGWLVTIASMTLGAYLIALAQRK
jgi:hypothetical protein